MGLSGIGQSILLSQLGAAVREAARAGCCIASARKLSSRPGGTLASQSGLETSRYKLSSRLRVSAQVAQSKRRPALRGR